MRKTICAMAFMLCATPAYADDEWTWTRGDIVRELAFTGLVFLDWQSTRVFLREGRDEKNPLVGSRPSDLKLGVACLTGAATHAVISAVLPRKWRKTWQMTSLALEAGVVARNYYLVGGVKFNFDFGPRRRAPELPQPNRQPAPGTLP